MTATLTPIVSPVGTTSALRRPVAEWLAPLDRLAAKAPGLVSRPLGQFDHGGTRYEIPRYVFVGNRSTEAPIRVGIFAGLHGDEPEGVRAVAQLAQLFVSNPALAAGYAVSLYPVCNPTGLEDRTRHSRNGKDLNREFWRNSAEPEVQLLQAELVSQRFDGVITLHTGQSSGGFHGLVRGATLARHLLRPALAAAAELLPVSHEESIDGFHARDGLVKDGFESRLSAPPKARPKPFEIVLEAPGQAPVFLRETALVIALHAILAEYRKFIAYAANL